MINEKLPHEVFAKCEKIRYKADRQKYLEEYQTFAVRTILQLNYDPNITLDLPEGKPPYREDKAPAGHQLQPIKKAIKILGQLTPNSKLDKVKKEVKFIELLESIHAEDAKIIIAAKDGKLQDLYSKVTITLVEDAIPKLLPKKEDNDGR
jgi:hypothetical protein